MRIGINIVAVPRISLSSDVVLYGHKEVTTFSYTHDDKRRMSRKGTKKMKKNYLGFGLVYCVLALVIFSVLMSFYTKKKIDVVNEGMRNIALFPEISMGNSENGTPESLAHNAVNSWKFLSFVGDDVGFYSSIVDTENNGRVMFESQDFLAFRYYGEVETEVIEDSSDRYEAKDTQLVPGSTRFMFFGVYMKRSIVINYFKEVSKA